jgi:hypothetical protein
VSLGNDIPLGTATNRGSLEGVPPGRRLPAVLLVLALIAVPPIVLRALCIGKTCGSSSSATARVPFCPLPEDVKTLVAAGFYAGRSPEVMGVTASSVVVGGGPSEDAGVAWPSATPPPDARVPIAFFGDGVARGHPLPAGTGLDQIAATLADVLGFPRPFPRVRRGTAVQNVAAGEAPALIVEIVWRGVGTSDLRRSPHDWPYLRALIHAGAADATLDGTTGSMPLDPVATLTTIGTGGLPSQHGITGALLRNHSGAVVPAWGTGAPTSVISTLPDDLVNGMGQRPKVGLIAPDAADTGLVGDGWAYGNHPYDVKIGSSDPLPALRRLLSGGYGADATPDVLGVVLGGSIDRMDERTREIVAAVRSTGATATFALAASGTLASSGAAIEAGTIASQLDRTVGGTDPIVAAEVPGGLFLDQTVLAQRGLSSNAAVEVMLQMRSPSGDGKLFADAFPGFAVSFARFC